MEDFERNIRQHNLNRQLHIGRSFTEFFEKGKAAEEGEIREWGEKKYKKTSGKWVPVSDKKKSEPKPAPNSQLKKPENEEESSSSNQMSGGTVGNHDKAKLTLVKTLYQNNPVEAYKVAEELSDEAKNVIPQKVWNEMYMAHHFMTDPEEEKDKKTNNK